MTEAARIRVLVVDDHAVLRGGLAGFLRAFGDLEEVGEAASGQEAIRLCDEVRPDVVLMGLDMPDMSGIVATRAIKQKHPDVQVIALDAFPKDEIVKEALRSGAIGYLLEDVSAEELADAIRAAHAGRPALAPKAAQVLMRAAMEPSAGHELTSREREILALMVQGLSNTKIARQLMLGRSTVKFHVSNILSKMGASSRTEAVFLALRSGLVN